MNKILKKIILVKRTNAQNIDKIKTSLVKEREPLNPQLKVILDPKSTEEKRFKACLEMLEILAQQEETKTVKLTTENLPFTKNIQGDKALNYGNYNFEKNLITTNAVLFKKDKQDNVMGVMLAQNILHEFRHSMQHNKYVDELSKWENSYFATVKTEDEMKAAAKLFGTNKFLIAQDSINLRNQKSVLMLFIYRAMYEMNRTEHDAEMYGYNTLDKILEEAIATEKDLGTLETFKNAQRKNHIIFNAYKKAYMLRFCDEEQFRENEIMNKYNKDKLNDYMMEIFDIIHKDNNYKKALEKYKSAPTKINQSLLIANHGYVYEWLNQEEPSLGYKKIEAYINSNLTVAEHLGFFKYCDGFSAELLQERINKKEEPVNLSESDKQLLKARIHMQKIARKNIEAVLRSEADFIKEDDEDMEEVYLQAEEELESANPKDIEDIVNNQIVLFQE